MAEKSVALIVHNVRSAYNVGAILRTADGAGVARVYLTGYTPRPAQNDAVYRAHDQKMIAKTALGAECTLPWHGVRSIGGVLKKLRSEGFTIVALEQDARSMPYTSFTVPEQCAVIVGNEPHGLSKRILDNCDVVVEIPMYGTKNSLNVAVACGIMTYYCKGVQMGTVPPIGGSL